MGRSVRHLYRDTNGAVAATVALSLTALIAIGGLAFDYSRLAGLDTELQQAADQAALAAASQLDRQNDAITRADKSIKATSNGDRLAANFTRFANDKAGLTVNVTTTYCSAFDDSKADSAAPCTVTTDQTKAQFVVVTTASRVANYALTPILGLLKANVSAVAVAGVQSSICNVSPLMVCTPRDDFPTDSDIGKGIIMKTAGGASWVPGNYGLLDFGSGNTGVINALLGHGLNGCQETADTTTEPGNKNVTDAVNTRMDIYEGTGSTNSPAICNLATGDGCPAANTRKDMTMTMTYEITQSSTLPVPTPAACGTAATAKNGNPNPSISYATSFSANSQSTGFTRDSCHYSGTCTDGNFGDKNWNRAAYIAANHPAESAASIAAAIGGSATAATLTRYQIYKWELDNQASGKLDPQQIGTTPPPATKGNKYTFTKQCAFNKPKLASSAYPPEKDRRTIPIIAANCSALKGKGTAYEDFVILKVFDVFLTEPSLNRSLPGTTDDKEIYGEVIGPASYKNGGSGFQYYSRNKPYLVR